MSIMLYIVLEDISILHDAVMEYMEEAQEVVPLNMGHMNIIIAQHLHIRIHHVQKAQEIQITPKTPDIVTGKQIGRAHV